MAASVKMVAMVVPIIFLAATTLTFDLVNRHVPGPYMVSDLLQLLCRLWSTH